MPGNYFPPGYFPPGFFPPGYFPSDLAIAGGVTIGNARNLAEAIEAKFLATAKPVGGLTALYESEAGESPTLPYAVYTIAAGPTYYHSSTSYWRDNRVRFKVIAAQQQDADSARDWLAGLMGVGDYPYQTGFSIPFFEANQGEGKEPGWGRGTARMFNAWVEYSARCKRVN